MITIDQLAVCTGAKVETAATWFDDVVQAMKEHEIDSKKRMAAFLANIGIESGGLRITEENLNYTTPARLLVVFPKQFTSIEEAEQYVNNPEKLANKVYGLKNGNRGGTDGWDFRGSGLAQLTGYDNFKRAGEALNCPYVEMPLLVREFRWHSAQTAGWFWKDRGLNQIADVDAFQMIVKRFNGAYTALDERVVLWEKAKASLGV
jgi:putative chitinase